MATAPGDLRRPDRAGAGGLAGCSATAQDDILSHASGGHGPARVNGVAVRRVASTFVTRGLDIFAPRGTPVRSITEGVMMRVGTNRLGGRVVWVVGPGGHRHYYAHLDQQADLSVGQRVVVGTQLGTVGQHRQCAWHPAVSAIWRLRQ